MDNFGTGPSRVLDPATTAYLMAIWQQGKPPCDSELNLAQQIADNWNQVLNLRGVPSGFLGNETNPREDYETSSVWSNWFKFGRQRTGETKSIMWATVNGWLVPVIGTRTGAPPGTPNNTDTWNHVDLDPPPANAGDYRVDFIFLEVWKARIQPNPSTTNKPGSAYVWKYGNVEGGMMFLADDIKDPAMGFETTQRVQLQYRIRVVTGLIGLASFPDGFDPSVVKAKAAYLPNDPTAVTSYTFTNMREELGDPGLWRAGDGTSNSLGTVDGYVYAVPICAVFRRNAVAWNGEPSQNLNGSFNRNPTAVDRTGIKILSNIPAIATLGGIDDAATAFTLSTTTNIALPTTPATDVLIRIGDELMRYTSIVGTTVTISERGALGTRAEAHPFGAQVTVESGRPDGLYADQIAQTDILDLRHLVNPNGFNYESLLKANFDKLLRGDMHGTWKYTGAGPQGTYVPYQDVIGTAATLGVTKIDAADNFRQIFSDAASVQKIEAIIQANGDAIPADVNVTWTLGVSVQQTARQVSGQLNPANTLPGQVDTLVIPVSQFKNSMPGADQDQVRFVNDGATMAVSLRIDGMAEPLPAYTYTVTPANPTSTDDLTITLNADFPANTTEQVYVTFHVLYGAGRGLSRRPHSLQSICYYNPASGVMVQPEAMPTNNVPMRVAWAPTWPKYNGSMYFGALPTTAEAYADLGSKTVILTPWRRIVMPVDFRALDGSSLWHSTTTVFTGTQGMTGAPPAWTTVFQDATVNFVAAGVLPGMRLEYLDITGTRVSYAIIAVGTTSLTLTENAGPLAAPVAYSIYSGEGLMPTKARDGLTPKWALTDPLDLFSGGLDTNAARKDIYVEMPRHLVPTWGAVYVPIQFADPDVGNFNEGVNFLISSKKGGTRPNSESNYVPYPAVQSAQFFSTQVLVTPFGAAIYNAAYLSTGASKDYAGIRKYTDARGLGRKGLELPPFYGIARLYAIYEADDFITSGSGYDNVTREVTGSGATNLLRQNFDGPVFWIEIDDDGDSTFILNADALDTNKSPNPITFDTGEFVIEASIFGFDRDAFDPEAKPRIVLTRDRNQLNDLTTRTNNVGISALALNGPICVIPAPPAATDKILINYNRTPYQGDVWGSQSSNIDVGYNPGPLTTGVAWQLVSTDVTEETVVLDNPKQMEVLASIGFVTTLGTGRMSTESFSVQPTDPTNPGGELPTSFPPTGPTSPRPRVQSASLTTDEAFGLSTQYLGSTSELPLGALFRDKDFRGGLVSLSGVTSGPLIYLGHSEPALSVGGPARASGLEHREVILGSASMASGQAGEVVFHVDGNDGNYALLTSFRTFRGGSIFTGNGPRPGGPFQSLFGKVDKPSAETNVLAGTAMLVRNHVTNIGATEVSAGDELLMLIVTSANRLETQGTQLQSLCGSNGSGEGRAAADFYRIEGHPLVRDHVRVEIDPNTITLARKVPVVI